jgi:hypothetical protein
VKKDVGLLRCDTDHSPGGTPYIFPYRLLRYRLAVLQPVAVSSIPEHFLKMHALFRFAFHIQVIDDDA